jgi:hypothetical protein
MALIAAGLLLCACSMTIVRGSGRLVTEPREVRGFDRVALTGSGDVILTQGERESLTVETDDNVMRHVVTEVRGGTLTLGTRSGASVSPTRLRFVLTIVDLNGLTVSGSGNVSADRVDADRFEVKVTGSGNAAIGELEAGSAMIEIAGSGNVALAGQVRDQEATVSGSGNYAGGDLRSESASVRLSGSGNATLWATESLDVRVTGSGTASYYGGPSTHVSSSGSGTVRRLGDK